MCNCKGSKKLKREETYESEQMLRYRKVRGELLDAIQEFNLIKELTLRELPMLSLERQGFDYSDEKAYRRLLLDTEIELDDEDILSIISTDVRRMEFGFYLTEQNKEEYEAFFEAVDNITYQILVLNTKTGVCNMHSAVKRLKKAIVDMTAI